MKRDIEYPAFLGRDFRWKAYNAAFGVFGRTPVWPWLGQVLWR